MPMPKALHFFRYDMLLAAKMLIFTLPCRQPLSQRLLSALRQRTLMLQHETARRYI